ncbi:MAG: MFS transporter [Candidatus Saccharimonadaceae bacterium]|nr:MFS transporter [Candidatus Saccharimonadaceae bacterium]
MHHHLGLRSKMIIMLSVMASLFLVALDQMVFTTSLGKIVEEFNSFSSLSWVLTAYMITTTITVPIAGKLSDLFGRKIMLLIGIAVFAIGSLLGGMAAEMNQLILWRAFQGIGGGIITANTFAIVGDLFAARERGKWQGLIGAVFGISSVAGPLIGGFLTESNSVFGMTTNWRWTLLMNVPVAVIAFIIIVSICPSFKTRKKPVVDYLGTGLLAGALAILILAIDNTEKIFADVMASTGLSLVNLRIIMFSAVALSVVLLILVERRAKEPVLPLYFFKNRNFVTIMAVALMFGAVFLGSILYLTQFNQQVFGATPTQSGLMLLPMVGGLMLTSVTVGQLISRYGKYKIFMISGFSLAAISVLLLLNLNPDTSYTYEAVVMFFLGMGMGVGMPTINLVVQNEFEQKDLGVATSSSQLFRGLGSTIGVAVFGAILTASLVSNQEAMTSSKYIQLLKNNPAASQMGNLDNSDTLLMLNTPGIKQKITDEANKTFEKMPKQIQIKAKDDFISKQNEYALIVTKVYSSGMHMIFIVASIVMTIATVVTMLIDEKPLRSAKPTDTPGEI